MKNLITLIFSLFVSFQSLAEFKPDYLEALRAYLKEDYETALLHWVTLANGGDAHAQRFLGLMYDNGKGVLENDKTAVKWYTKAAEQGQANAQYHLAVMYANGYGVLENDKTAVKWYIKAAEQGLAQAQTNLGLMYAKGEGVVTSNIKAYAWYNLAAYIGYKDAATNKDSITKEMTNEQIAKAQELSQRCLDSGYKDCPYP